MSTRIATLLVLTALTVGCQYVELTSLPCHEDGDCPTNYHCGANGFCARGLCPAGQIRCGGSCVDTSADPSNCGACGETCNSPTTACVRGACACPNSEELCNGSCIDTHGDNSNCGACGHVCPSNSTCVAAVCQCPQGQTECEGACVDRTSDEANCGACGHVCSQNHADSTCEHSACVIHSCSPDYRDCHNGGDDGCEAHLPDDVENCGACDHVCAQDHGAVACTSGACVITSCATGFDNCNEVADDGCETDLSSSVAHCGACDTPCVTPNAVPICLNKACNWTTCQAGFADCDEDHDTGCEAETITDRTHCGACDHACGAAELCLASTCRIPTVTTIQTSNLTEANGPGALAELFQPTAMAVDSAGNTYVATGGYSWIAGEGPATYQIRKVDPRGNVTTFASKDHLGNPFLNRINALTVDAAGNLYAVEQGQARILKIAPSGTTTSFAGDGQDGFNDGPPELAEFFAPHGLAADGDGNLYVADTGNHLIRKITPSGQVTTYAGSGTNGLLDAPGLDAQFSSPVAVAVDSHGNVFVVDQGACIRKIDGSLNVTTVGGNCMLMGDADGTSGPTGTAQFMNPGGLAVDDQGNIYVADGPINHRIRKVDAGGAVTTVAGNGMEGFLDGTGGRRGTARLTASDIGIDRTSGNLLFTDDSGRLRQISAQGDVTTVAGNGTIGTQDGTTGTNATAAVGFPVAIASIGDGAFYFLEGDPNSSSLRKLGADGQITTIAGTRAGDVDGPGATALFSSPQGLALDGAGNIFVADMANHRIRRVDGAGNVTTFAGNGTPGFQDGTGGRTGSARFNSPTGVAVDSHGNVFVADSNNHRIRKITSTGTVSTFAGTGSSGFTDGPGDSAKFNLPWAIAVDAAGSVYVSDSGNRRIRKISPAGYVTTLAGNGGFASIDGTSETASFADTYGLALDSHGELYVGSVAMDNRVRRVDVLGNVVSLAGGSFTGFVDGTGGPMGTARFFGPIGLTIGLQGQLVVTDTHNRRIRVLTP